MVKQAGFFSLPHTMASKSRGADRFQYKLTVEEDKKPHTVLIDESAVPELMRPLIEWMTSRAKSIPRNKS